MRTYKIEIIKCDEGKHMLTCTPPPMYENVVSIRYASEDESRWLHCIEVLGFYEFYSSAEDLHERFVEMKKKDEKMLAGKHIDEFDGIPLTGFTDGFCTNDPDDPRISLIRYAILLSRVTDTDRLQRLIEKGLGHCSDEIDLEGC